MSLVERFENGLVFLDDYSYLVLLLAVKGLFIGEYLRLDILLICILAVMIVSY